MQPEPDWVLRFRAARVSLPGWALDNPQRCLYASNATGVVELYVWDRDAGTHRQATSRPNGTPIGTLEPTGEHLWWFDDTDGDEWGVWMRQPFEGGPDEPAVAALEPSYPVGLALGGTVSAVGRSTDDGSSIHLVRDGEASTLYAHANDAHVGALSRDETLLCIAHSEHGDSRHMALRVFGLPPGDPVADLWDGQGKHLSPSGFSPVRGDSRLLVVHERRGRAELLIWDPIAETEQELSIDLPGQIDADWYQDGTALLVSHDRAARTELYRFDIATETLTPVETPAGVVSGATARPDGTVEYAWSSSANPPSVRNSAGEVVLRPPGPAAPESVPLEDLWVDGPGGPIHALVAKPGHLLPPYATVFAIHGGPDSADEDAFRPRRAAFVDAGYCVVHVNYRGSAGYGAAWRDALEGNPGLTELADIAAVRDWVVGRFIADPDRCILEGGSWGGYLTLLGLGTQPELWAAGIAAVPVADYVAAYNEEMEPLRAFDRALFGGSPEQVPERYQRSSPITYIEKVQAPVFILAGANDPRCPMRQIDNYLSRLAELEKPHEIYRYDAGHGSLVVDEQIRQMALEIDFAHRHVRP